MELFIASDAVFIVILTEEEQFNTFIEGTIIAIMVEVKNAGNEILR